MPFPLKVGAQLRSLFTKPSTCFQILSDLHLEVGQQYSGFEIPPSAPYLILAGDIGRLVDYEAYLGFLAKQTKRFETVFLVLGNHEFYGLSFAAAVQRAQKLQDEPVLNGRLILLNQTCFEIPNSCITILGRTLWSRIADNAKDVVRMRIKDFQKIEGWTVDDHNTAHESDVTWLKHQIASIQEENKTIKINGIERQIIVVTHHAPSIHKTSSPENVDNAWSSAFATELLVNNGEWDSVKGWVFGHTHFTTEFKKCGITVVSNQRGYVLPGNKQTKGQDRTKDKERFSVNKVLCI